MAVGKTNNFSQQISPAVGLVCGDVYVQAVLVTEAVALVDGAPWHVDHVTWSRVSSVLCFFPPS